MIPQMGLALSQAEMDALIDALVALIGAIAAYIRFKSSRSGGVEEPPKPGKEQLK